MPTHSADTRAHMLIIYVHAPYLCTYVLYGYV